MSKRMLVIGECMMELVPTSPTSYQRSFAGDTYNSAVYAKRYAGELSISYFTALGEDAVSESMLACYQAEGIETADILHSSTLQPGIYCVATDEHGERSFQYWRANSAATQMMTLLADANKPLPNADLVYFSGISLAILSDDDKAKLLRFIAELRTNGARIAFDPNYRPRMWRDTAHAVEWLEKSYAVSDIALPGLEDHDWLLGHQDYQSICDYVTGFGVQELVIKCGKLGMYAGAANDAKLGHVPFTPAPKQVDSTAAGDSFAGTYLAARLSGEPVLEAVSAAAKVAGVVVQHRGAIIDKDVYATELAD